ncbi:unnamed protein product, partial [Ostreobium quekettii]
MGVPARPPEMMDGRRHGEGELVCVVDQLLSCGNQAFRQSHYDEAIGFYDRALTIDTRNYRALCNRSAAHLAAGHRLKSLGDARRSTLVKPDGQKGYYRLGMAFMQLCCWELAGHALRQAREKGPGGSQL